MANMLITGASGFIGANLVRNLINTKDQIHILIRKQSNLPTNLDYQKRTIGFCKISSCIKILNH